MQAMVAGHVLHKVHLYLHDLNVFAISKQLRVVDANSQIPLIFKQFHGLFPYLILIRPLAYMLTYKICTRVSGRFDFNQIFKGFYET